MSTDILRIAIAQLKPTLGDLAGNVAKARAARAEAHRQGADLVLFTELFISGYLPEDLVRSHLADGRLIRVLDDWCAPFSGCHLYYPSRRQPTPAFAVLVDGLRYRG